MRNLTRFLVTLLAAVVALALVGLLLAYFGHSFLADLWWFRAVGYEGFFWHRLFHDYGLYFGSILILFLFFLMNFRLGARYLGAKHPLLRETGIGSSDAPPDRQRYRKKYRRVQKTTIAFYLPVSLVLAVVLSLPMIGEGEKVLLALFAQDTGITDPVYGRDISYYLFSLPVQIVFFREILFGLAVLLLGLILLYWLEARTLPRADKRLHRGARIHLHVVTLLLLAVAVGYFVLQARLLLYTDSHMPLFYGPGYVERQFILPMIWSNMALLLAAGLAFIFFVDTRKGLLVVAAMTALFFVSLGIRHFPYTTEALQEYVVQPNEATLEAPYIANNIEATLGAYNLADVETREYPIRETPWDLASPEKRLNVESIPIWDEDGLLPLYRELQSIRSYYSFDSVDVGRYSVKDVYRQVFLAVREINLDGLATNANSWVNRWLKYTHGYGAVMTSAAQEQAGPLDFLVQGIPPSSDFGLSIEEPAIYYGLGKYHPAIAPNESRELDFSAGHRTQLSDYQGESGVKLSSRFRKLVFALHFGEKNVFFTDQTNEQSRILFRRNIVERITELTPFLLLDPDPYAVVTPERIYWIQDAYTHSSWYPYARPYDGRFNPFGEDFNYIRNAVKIVVDAYDGSVDYYIADKADPIIGAYSRIHPEVFRPMSEMPAAIQRHVRYPKSLFDIQMDVYGRYHQQDPGRYYKEEDFWTFPVAPWREDLRVISSNYLTLNLIDRNRWEYSLFLAMTPSGKRNMRTLAIAGCDGDNYGRIITYTFPAGTVVYGPGQVDSIIKQDPAIARQIGRWDREGSEVDRGRMVIMPIGGGITYVQGVFLEARTPARLPELARIIVSRGQMVAMEPSIEEAFEAVNALIEKTSAPPSQELPPPSEPPEVAPGGGSE